MQAPLPPDETERLATLAKLGILDTPPEERFDRITRVAQRVFDVPIVLITLVDANRQWFKACLGVSYRETDRSISFCAHAILAGETMLVPDTLQDARFRDNPVVVGDPYVRFYAGRPLAGHGGHRLGTLCVIDVRPRMLTPDDLRVLEDLAAWAEDELNAVQLGHALADRQRAYERVAEMLAGREALVGLARRLSAEGGAQRVLETALQTATQLVGGDDAGIARWDDQRRVLVQVASRLTPRSNGAILELDRTASGRAVRAGRPVILNDYQRLIGQDTPAGAAGAQAVIAVPLLHEGRLLGTLSVSALRTHHFRPEDAELLELLAGIVAAALATTEAFEHQRQAVTELERLSRAKSDFVSTVSHEFRTPLTGILGFSELLRDEQLSPEEQRDLAADINSETRRLARMITDMLDLDRMESGKMVLNRESVNLSSLLREVVERVRSTVADHVIHLELDPDLPDMLADRDKLVQITTNLLSNAVKFSPDGGDIVVSASVENGMLHLRVRDDGLGVPRDALEAIFERYARVEQGRAQRISGTGLGLPIVREIARLHGGWAWAEPAPDRGSIFHVRLPLAESTGEHAA